MSSVRGKRTLRISEAARTIFYTPLLATVAAGFLHKEGLSGTLGPISKGIERLRLLNEGEIHVIGNTPTLSFLWLERGEQNLPPQVAAMNHRDGFYIVSREPREDFRWTDLEEASLVSSSFSLQPWASLRFCLAEQGGVDYRKIKLIGDFPTMTDAEQAFRGGTGDYAHLQEPLASRLEEDGVGHIVASVGQAQGPIAFSTLAMSREFLTEEGEVAEAFMRAYYATLRWLVDSDAETIVDAVKPLFPDTAKSALVRSVEGYKSIGAWLPDPVISKASYERMVEMWIFAGHMTKRYRYGDVVHSDLAERVITRDRDEM